MAGASRVKPTLITGATGFLGQHLVAQLREPVRVLNRGDMKTPGVDVVRGDVTVPADVDRAMKGCGRVYHLAGLVSRQPADREKMMALHVDGTRVVLDAARRHGLERAVVASSSGTIAVSRDAREHDEESGYKEKETARWAYYITKIAQEKAALAFHAETKFPVIVVNPSLLLGPGDERCSSTGDVILFLEGQVLSLPTGGLNFVDARDAAAGAAAAMERGRPGERYLLGGVNWTAAQFMRELARLSGRRAPFLASPTWMSLLTAPLLRRAMPLAGRKFDIDDETIEISGVFWYCNSAKARRELGYTAREPEATLRDTLEDIYRRRPESKR
ncbi:MAG: NAD-dependent epimerase/dehydratase family protein [Acidobacteria bacterium]|nr:NAD-dependent epimerase/dehydratase family protein [Acidobacteriota bacterium]